MLLSAASAFAVVDVNKSFAPLNVQPGQTATLVIELTNSASAPATGATLLDVLPPNVTVVSLGANTCGGSWTSPAAGQLQLTGGTVPAASGAVSGRCRVTAVVSSTVPGTYVNTIAAGDLASSEGTNPQPASATLTVGPVLNVTGSKVFTPAVLHGGGLRRFTITLTNPNPALALTGVSFIDTFPAQVVVGAPVFTATTCGGLIEGRTGAAAFAAPADGNTAVRLTGGTIPAGGSCTISVDVRPANPNAALDANVTNTLPIGAVTSTQGATNAAAISAVLRVQTGAQVAKAFAPATITAGGTSVVTLTLRNYNLTPIANASITDVMPAGVTVVPASVSTTCGGAASSTVSTTVLTAGTIPAAPSATVTGFGSCTITATVTAAAAGSYNNTITAGSFAGVAYGATNAVLTVNPAGAVGVSKTFVPNNVPQTGTTTLTITLTNAGAGPAAITSFTDNLLTTMGAGIAVATAPPASTTCGGTVAAPPGATVVTKSDGAIPAAGSCTITVPLVVAPTAVNSTRTNTIAAGALVTTTGSNTFAASAQLVVARAAGLAKSFAPATIGPGLTSRLTITVSHVNGAVAFTGLGLVDNLPAGHTVAATPAVTNTCGGAVTATPGTSTITLAGGSLPAGATSCSIAVTVQAPGGAGAATNTIPANALVTTEGVTFNAAASAVLTRTVPPGVILNKGFTPTNVSGGAPSTLSLIVANNGPGAAALSNVSLTDVFPSGMQVFATPAASFSGGGCTAAAITAVPGAGQVSFTGASITAGAVCTLTVQVTSVVDGNLVNDIPIGTLTSAQGATNLNAPSATLTVQRNVNVAKFFTPPIAERGATSVLTIRLINTNTSARTGAAPAVVDTLPAGLVVAAGPIGTTCAGGVVLNGAGAPLVPGDTVVRLDGGVVPSGGNCDVSVPVTGAVSGLYTNTIPVGAIATLEGGTNSLPAVADLRLVEPPTISKAFAPATIAVGGSSTITFTLTNANAATLLAGGFTGAGFTDTLVNMAIAVPGAAGGTCVGAATNAFSVGQTALTFTGLTIPPASSCTVTVDVASTVAGVHPNVTSGVASAQTVAVGLPSNAPVLTVLGPPTIGKTFSPALVAPGVASTLTISIVNPNATVPLTLGAPAFVDALPAAPGVMTLASGVVSTTCPGGLVEGRTGVGPFGPPAAGNTELRVSGGSVPAGGACTVTASVVTSLPGTYVNVTSPVVSLNAGTSLAGGVASLEAQLQADLQVTKTATLSPYVPGAVQTYVVVVTNAGPNDVTGARVQDTLTGALAAFTWTCASTGGGVCPAAGAGTIDVLVDVPATATATFTLTGLVPSNTLGTLVNTARVTAPATVVDLVGANDEATVSTPATLEADLAVSKSSTPSPYVPGLPLTYTVVVSNLGPSDAPGARLVDVLPAPLAAFTWNCVATGGGACGTASGVGNIDMPLTLPAGTSVTVTITGTVPSNATGSLLNTATVAPPLGLTDPVPGNNGATDASPVDVRADLSITKASTPNPYVPGLPLTYTVVVANAGPSDITGARVQDALPPALAAFTWTCVPGAGASCASSAGTGIIDTLVSLPAGANATFVLTGTVPPGLVGPLVNTTSVALPAGAFDPVPGNNIASDANATSVIVDLAIDKTSSPNPYLPGAPLTYTIVVSNAGPSTAVDARVQDALPLPLRAFTWSCSGAAGGVCGTAAGAGDIDVFVTLPPGATTTFVVSGVVPVATTGELINTATVAPPAGATDPTPANRTSTVVNASGAAVIPGGAELQLTHTFPPTVAPGGVATFTYTSTNRGPGTAIDLMIDGMIPAGTSIASIVPSPGGVVSIVNGMFVVTWPGPTQPGEARTVTLALRVDPAAVPGSTVWNWIMTSSATPDPYQPNNFVDSYVFVGGGPPADLVLNGVVQNGREMGRMLAVGVGDTASMLLAVTNGGTVPARGQYALVLDDGGAVQVVRATTSSGALAVSGPSSGVWETGLVAPGSTATLQLDVRVATTKATTLLVARVEGAPADPDATNDQIELSIDGIGAAPLSGRSVALANLDGGAGAEIVTAAGQGETPQIRAFSGAGEPVGTPYYAFERTFDGGVRLASCDVDGDGRDEIVAAQGPGGGAVRVIRVSGATYSVAADFTPFESGFLGGVFVACADVDGNGRGEIVTGAGAGRAPDVRVFSIAAGGAIEIAAFAAYEPAFAGGVRVSAARVPSSVVGDFNVVTTPGPGRPVELAIWRISGGTASALARVPVGADGGAHTALGDADNDGAFDLAVMPDAGTPALLTLYGLASGAVRAALPPGALGFAAGMQMAIGDLGQGVQEVVTVDGAGAAPRVQVFQLNAAGGVQRLGFLALELP